MWHRGAPGLPRKADMSARDERVGFDIESETLSRLPLDVKQRHAERQAHRGRSRVNI